MQITISDHDSTHYGKSAGWRFWIKYLAEKEYTTWINFADWAAWLVAAGEFDGYEDTLECGHLWRYVDDEGGCITYTFQEVISEFMLTGDLDEELKKYLAVKMVIEDLVLEAV